MNTWDDEVTLLKVEIGDEDGYPTDPIETRRTVYANKKSATRTEFYAANQSGLRADVVLEIHAYEYEGERYLEHNGKRYEIIRTYSPSFELVELTCTDLSQRVKDNGTRKN